MSFHSRILLAFVGLILLALVAASTVMFVAARRTGLGLAEQQLEVAARVLAKSLQSRDQEMRTQAATLASDFGFREAVTSRDGPTIQSALENQRTRIHADVFALISNDGSVAASTDAQFQIGTRTALEEALAQARERDTAPAILNFRGKMLQVVIVPIKAPEHVGWACVGAYIGDDFVQQVKETAGSEISLLSGSAGESHLLLAASTLLGPARRSLEQMSDSLAAHDQSSFQSLLGGESFLTLIAAGRNGVSEAYVVVLQVPMAAVAAPVIALRRDMIMFGGVALGICLLAALAGARMLAEPVRALSNAARSLSLSKRGSTSTKGDDELALVARSFHALVRRANYDSLTGLPNRALFNERLKESMERMRLAKEPLAVVFIDLDGFKKINDTLGHEMGDLVLRKAAQRLARSIAAPNTVARLGGDEFVLVLERTDRADVMKIVQSLAKLVGKSMSSPTGPVRVGMSAGIAMYPALTLDQEELLQMADAAMYLSKTQKAGPVIAARTVVVAGPDAQSSPAAPPAEINPPETAFDESATDAWAARDLLTQNTRAVSAIRTFRAAGIPSNESDRLHALRQLKYLDKPPRASFDRVTRLAAKILNAPIALVSLVDEDRQWFLSRVGIDATETPRDVSFCAHAVFEKRLLIVPDTAGDDRFAGNPLVVGDPQIRAYAGAPLYTSEGYAVGTLCVVDRKPRQFGESDVKALQDLALIIDDIIRIREFTLEYDRRRRKRSVKARSKAGAAG